MGSGSSTRLVFLAILALLFYSSLSFTSTPPLWNAPSGFQSGQGSIITFLTDVDSTVNKQFTFSNAFGSVPDVAYGLKSYSSNFWFILGDEGLDEEYQKIEISLASSTMTDFALQAILGNATTVNLLSVSYLAMETDFQYHFNIFT